jgi:hypothetical protein
MEPAVLYSILLYVLSVIVPLIPSILIYKFFPDTKVGAKGILGNLKINATGAFAAYIIVCTMYIFNVQKVQEIIVGSSEQTWTVKSKMVFLDTNGKPISGDQDKMVDLTDISFQPDIFDSKKADLVKFKVWGRGRDIIITFSQDNFKAKTFDLETTDDNVKIDDDTRTVNLGTVILTKIGTGSTIQSEIKSIDPDPSGSGPPLQNNN